MEADVHEDIMARYSLLLKRPRTEFVTSINPVQKRNRRRLCGRLFNESHHADQSHPTLQYSLNQKLPPGFELNF